MAYEVKIIADSVGPNGARITTYQLRFPRFILAQFNTHRAISKNARSSRAVPTHRLLEEIENDPVIPIEWGKNSAGMVAKVELQDESAKWAEYWWRQAKCEAIATARAMASNKVHKQIVNRLLEPFMWADVVATATDWMNFFALRCSHEAQPEMRKLAVMMAIAYRDSKPIHRKIGEWHLPYVTDEEIQLSKSSDDPGRIGDQLIAASVVRCRRVSYKPFDGNADSPQDEMRKHDEGLESGHWSPYEHQAKPTWGLHRSGNFWGWTQYRQLLPKFVHEEFDFSTLDTMTA